MTYCVVLTVNPNSWKSKMCCGVWDSRSCESERCLAMNNATMLFEFVKKTHKKHTRVIATHLPLVCCKGRTCGTFSSCGLPLHPSSRGVLDERLSRGHRRAILPKYDLLWNSKKPIARHGSPRYSVGQRDLIATLGSWTRGQSILCSLSRLV